MPVLLSLFSFRKEMLHLFVCLLQALVLPLFYLVAHGQWLPNVIIETYTCKRVQVQKMLHKFFRLQTSSRMECLPEQ